MTEMFRTTIRLYEERPADQEALRLLHRIHDEKQMSYAEAIVAAVNSYYGEKHENQSCFNEKLRDEIRAIIRDELAATPVSIGSLLQAIGQLTVPPPPSEDHTADDADLDAMLDSFGS